MDQASSLEITPQDQELILLLAIGLGAMLLLALMVIFFYVYYRRRFVKQEQNLEFYQQKLLDAEIIVQEEERGRIAKDLHDVVGSILSASKMFVGQLKADLDTERHANLKAETTQLIDQAISNVRNIIYDILPVDLKEFGLVSVLDNQFDSYSKANQTVFEFVATANARLPLQEELAIYRIVQELISNTLKYAEANKASLQLRITSDRCEFAYEDNGKGFDLQTLSKDTPSNRNLGLKSIRSRIAFLGAEYQIHSQPGQGFRLQMNYTRKPTNND